MEDGSLLVPGSLEGGDGGSSNRNHPDMFFHAILIDSWSLLSQQDCIRAMAIKMTKVSKFFPLAKRAAVQLYIAVFFLQLSCVFFVICSS